MDTSKVYFDSEGAECSIWQMVKREPTWAAVRIQEGEKAIDEITTLRQRLDEKTRQATRWASECDTIRQQLAKSEARVAELEEGLHGIANCAYGYNHPKAQTADEAASWMNVEAMRLLGDPQSNAYALRKQAEAVEALRDSVKELYPLEPFGDLDEYVIAGMKEVYTFVEKSAQHLRQQADEAERAGGER